MNIIMLQKAVVATHVAALTHDYRANCLLIKGGSGIGKSESQREAVEMLARIINKPVGFVIAMLANYTSVDLMGFMMPHLNPTTRELQTIFSSPPWFPTEKNTWVFDPQAEDPLTGESTGRWFSPGTHPTDPVPDEGVLFLDEYSTIEEDVQKPAGELILNAQIGERRLKLGWRVLAAGNRLSDRAGSVRELRQMINRRCLLNAEAHLGSWVSWAERQSGIMRPHYMTINFCRSNPQVVFQDVVPDHNNEFCSARSTCKMDMDLRALRTAEEVKRDIMPTSDMAREFCIGWIGEAAAAQYFTHLKYYERIPEIEDIVKSPDKALLPIEKDAQMVTAYKLAHHIDTNTAEPIFAYMKRLHKEMQILCVNATIGNKERRNALRLSPSFGPWIIENGDLLLAAKA